MIHECKNKHKHKHKQIPFSDIGALSTTGGHTLGRATNRWKGQWTEGLEAFALNNRYYRNILANN